MIRTSIVLVVAALLVATVSRAQDSERIDELERLIEEQQRQLDELKRQLEELREEASSDDLSTDEGALKSADSTKSLPGPLVVSKSDNLVFTLSGRVHRMVMFVDDDLDTTTLFTDSEQGPTMIRADVLGSPSELLSLGSTLELGIRQNRPFQVSQDEPDAGTDVTVRHAEVFLDGSKFGKLSLGRGFAAAWVAPELDLSGTQFASLLPVGMLAPGLKFADRTTEELSDIRVRDHFVDVERLLLVDRLRYDSPRYSGVQISGSIAQDERWDIALRTRHSPGNWTVHGAASYQDEPFVGIDSRIDGGISIRHEPTGLNFTAGLTDEQLSEGRSSSSFIVKGGWLADLFKIGRTAFSADFFETSDLRVEGDQARSIGFFVVQKWPDFGLDFYTGFRRYDVDRSDFNLEPLLVVPLGVVLSF